MSNATILSDVREIIADVLDQPDLKIDRTTTAEDVEGWDSFSHINIVVAMESHFGIKIHTSEIEELRNVGELVDIVEKKLEAKKPG
jgi:acyl carrier protein